MLVLQIITLLIVCECIGFGYTQTNNCGLQKFQCLNEECIEGELLCDGTAHCKDWSDETEAECTKIPCPDYAFRCNYGACIHKDSVCNGIQNCVDNSDETQCRTTDTSNQTSQLMQNSHSVVIRNTRTCTAPAQPQNGYWKLHQSQCPNRQECDVPEGTEPSLGSHLIYSCNPGYKIKGSRNVYCSYNGEWSDIPVCIEIRCPPLDTASTAARCKHNNEWMSCESSMLPSTSASLTCRNGYEPAFRFSSYKVTCNAKGQWEPPPLQCIPACGRLPAEVVPLIINGTTSNITEFPWHASLYSNYWTKKIGKRKYFCGASIIKENLLITSAMCVHDPLKSQVMDAKEIYVLTGNIYQDYDSPFHDLRLVRKNQVKNIYIMCNYLGYIGNYAFNIAILELVEPFVLSAWLVPVCIDSFSDLTVLEAGVYGKVPVFGRTATNESNAVLQALTMPYIPFRQCKSAAYDMKMEEFITIDSFCAGYTNGSSICVDDVGSGLVFKTDGLWYLRGIVSFALNVTENDGTVYCGSYSLHTRISIHIGWIQDVLNKLEQNQFYPSCQNNSESSMLSTTISSAVSLSTQSIPESMSHPVTSSIRTCRAPPQPQEGHWKLLGPQCLSGQDCVVPEGTELDIGSYLVYSCNTGYEIKGSSHVSCSFEGKWLNIPVCTEIRCRALSTASTEARCTYYDEWVSCESRVLPRTRASLSCRNSYQRDLSFFARTQVTCNASGQWDPEPIRCIPVCGKLPADVTPLIVNGVTPNITEFPWHASMYHDEPGEPKKYFCGASIIQENLLITAAHCVYNERTGRVSDKTIYIVTGNIFRDYDSPYHDSRLVRKNQVKNIYLMCDYIGLIGNYLLDIAILELVEPFVLSTWLVPVCIDFSSDLFVLEVGAVGKVAGFGRTAVSESSGILQALTVPYIPYYQCRNASQNANLVEYSIIDKFCAGYSNGSSVCDGDSGSGLVFKSEGLWYLRGIVSVALGSIRKGGITHCDNKFYSLYTRVSSHTEWMQDVIARLKQNQIYPPCREKI